MTHDATEPKRSQVTRQDRAIDDNEWIAAFLRRVPMAAIATAREEQPFQSTLLFALDESGKIIYFHTARRGARLGESSGEPARLPDRR